MTPRKWLALLLLAFIGVSAAYTVMQEHRSAPIESSDSATAPSVTQPAVSAATAARAPSGQGSAMTTTTATTAQPVAEPPPNRVVAFYFHGNARCYTCKMIEAYTKEAIDTGFSDALQNKSLSMRTVNVEEVWNEHYIQDFQLSNRSVVLVRYEGGKQISWKRLDQVWSFVQDKSAFIQFMQQEVRSLLKDLS